MSMSEESFDRRETDEPACASPLDKEIAQPSPPGDVLDGEGELVGGSPKPPSLETQARHRAALKTLNRIHAERTRAIKELRELGRGQLFYRIWKESVPDHEVRPLGAALAKRLAARKQTFAPRGAEGDLNLGIAFLHLAAVDPSAYVLLALNEPCSIRSLEREYWKIDRPRTKAAKRPAKVKYLDVQSAAQSAASCVRRLPSTTAERQRPIRLSAAVGTRIVSTLAASASSQIRSICLRSRGANGLDMRARNRTARG
jgi:hypothetical protein